MLIHKCKRFSGHSRSPVWAMLLALLLIGALSPADAQTLTADVGSGADTSYLVLQADAFGPSPLFYAYHYDHDPGNPLDGYALLSAVLAFDPLLDAEFLNFGTVADPNYFLNSVTYNSVTLTNTGPPAYSPYWAQWVSGGESGYPVAMPLAGNLWEFGSGPSAPYRFLAPGSWDGYVFSDGSSPPDIAPVPEPSSLILIVLAGFAGEISRRKKRSLTEE